VFKFYNIHPVSAWNVKFAPSVTGWIL
jgi:hypothetical protein